MKFSAHPWFRAVMIAALLVMGPEKTVRNESCAERTRALIAGAELDEALRLVKDDCPASPDLDFLTGYLLSLPFYDAYDPERSHQLMMRASDAGHPEAQNRIARQFAQKTSSLSDEQLLFAIDVLSQDVYERPFIANLALYALLLEDIPLLEERGLAESSFRQMVAEVNDSIVANEVGAAVTKGILTLNGVVFNGLTLDQITNLVERDAQQGLPEAQYWLAILRLHAGQQEESEFWFALAHAGSGDLGRPGEDFPLDDPGLNQRIEDWYLRQSEASDNLTGFASRWCRRNGLGLDCFRLAFDSHARCEDKRIMLPVNYLESDLYSRCREALYAVGDPKNARSNAEIVRSPTYPAHVPAHGG